MQYIVLLSYQTLFFALLSLFFSKYFFFFFFIFFFQAEDGIRDRTVTEFRRVLFRSGPGNPYVQTAKRQVYGTVDIDMIAGPSEVAIVADETCDPAWIAADLLAQAEHDEMAGAWLICWSREVAAAVFDEVRAQLEMLDRSAIARVAIVNKGITFIVAGEDSAIDLVNHIAPEHVEVLMAEPAHVSDNIKNAGAVFS